METTALTAAAIGAAAAVLLAAAWAFWRYYWFWRNPPRRSPLGPHFLSPADGTVVYVHRVPPDAPVIACKQGRAASINDVVREDLEKPKIHIGIFMSPFDVHYNRAPLAARVALKRQYPAQGRNAFMGSMHWRCLRKRLPIYAHSPHIVQNNRAVTRFEGQLGDAPVSYYVVQIGGGSVCGIDVFPSLGAGVQQGEVFGRIRVGSQVDLIVPDLPGFEVCVRPGERVVAGETVVVIATGTAPPSSGHD